MIKKNQKNKKKQEESENKNKPKDQEKKEDKDKQEEQTKPNEQGKKEYKPDIDGVIIDPKLPGNEEWKDIIIELKGIAKDAVAFGNGDDKKTVEYIIKWIHNHTEYDKRVYEGGNFNGYPLEWYRDWVKNNRKVGRGVCNVYADLFRYICGYADIPNKKIEASLFSVDQYDHVLNVVEINNEWLYFDLTNSDGVYDSDPRSTNKYDMIFATREQISFLYKKLENPVLN